MKKAAILFITLISIFSACQSHLDNVSGREAVQDMFENRYPNAWDVDWEIEGGMFVADFRDGLYERESWFLPDGTWVQTRTELPLNEVPKVVIDAALVSLGGGWYVEEADYFQSSSSPSEYYILDCNKVGSQMEAMVKVLPDGTVVSPGAGSNPGGTDTGSTTGNTDTGSNPGGNNTGNTGNTTGGNNNDGGNGGGNNGGGDVFAAAKAVFATMYPDAGNVEWEMEYGKVNVEFYQNRHEKEAWFLPDGTWLYTQTDIFVSEVPRAVADAAMAKLGNGWHIDDAEHCLSSSSPVEYYIIECENNSTDREARLRITPDGTVL